MSLETAAPAVAPADKNHTRTGIMKVVAPALHKALETVPGLNQACADTQRRILRAILTVGYKLALDWGMPVGKVFSEATLALQIELKERAAAEKENGATQPAALLAS